MESIKISDDSTENTNSSSRDNLKNLLMFLVKKLVRTPDDVIVQIDNSASDGLIVYRVSVNQSDMCRVVGKRGRIAKSLRQIFRVAGLNLDKKVALEIG